MPGTLDRYKGFPAIAASALRPGEIVTLAGGSGERRVMPLATNNALAFGVIDTRAASAAVGDAVTVYETGAVVEALSVASIGAGAQVGIASSNGSLGLVSGASGVVRTVIGDTLSPAGAGEYFELYVRPRVLADNGGTI